MCVCVCLVCVLCVYVRACLRDAAGRMAPDALRCVRVRLRACVRACVTRQVTDFESVCSSKKRKGDPDENAARTTSSASKVARLMGISI
jgi:hypothetical protein